MSKDDELNYRLEDLIDIPLFQSLLDMLNKVYSLPSVIVNMEGKVLAATAGQHICMKFHRNRHRSEVECRWNDQYLRNHLAKGNTNVSYRCPYGMVDNGIPIIIEGQHLGTFFAGQLFLEKPDLDFFKILAKKYEVNEKEYLEAVNDVPVWTEARLNQYLDLMKSLVYIITGLAYKNLREIELRKIIEAKEKSYRYLVENMNDIIWTLDTETMLYTYLSPSVKKIRGYTAEEVMSKPVGFNLKPEEAASLLGVYRQRAKAFLSGEINSDTYFTESKKVANKDGSPIWSEVITRYHLNPDTGHVEIWGVTRDVTERKRLEFEQQAHLEVVQGLIHTRDLHEYLGLVHQAIKKVFHAEYFYVVMKNKQTGLFERVYFYDPFDGSIPPSKMGKGLSAYVFRTATPLLLTNEKHSELLASGEIELVGRPSQSWLGVPLVGSEETIGVMAVQDYDQPGCYKQEDLSFMISISSPVALAIERMQAEAALRQSEEKFFRAFHTSPDAVNINRLEDGLFLEINQGFTRQTGYTAEDVIGKTSLEINVWTNPEDRQRLVEGLKEHGEVNNLEAVFRFKDGSTGVGLMSAKIIEINGEKCILSMTRSIDDLKQAQQEKEKLQLQLLHAQKMESVGRLAGGVAHDFNNLLGVIMGHAENALTKASPDQVDYRDLQEILKAARRSADLTRQLLTFARKQTISPRVLNLNETIASLLEMLHRLIGENIDLEWMPSPDLWSVCIDPSQIDQVMINLLVNARDAISGFGKVVIETRNRIIDQVFSDKHSELSPGEYVMLRISDNGIGMDEETRTHLFEPFFTTKEVGRGTGLGLATVYGIVKQNQGSIEVDSQPGQGTTITIYLPHTIAEPSPVPVPNATKLTRGTSEIILVVEDEESLLDLVKDILEELGYQVLSASNPTQALHIAKERGSEIRLLVTDVVMPGMNGRVLAEQINAFQPELKCLFMSGYTDDIIADHGVLPEGLFFIQKPFLLDEFAQKVCEALGASRAP